VELGPRRASASALARLVLSFGFLEFRDSDLTIDPVGVELDLVARLHALEHGRIAEAKIIVESWRRHFNTVRPHGSLGYKPPAPEFFVPAMTARAAAQTRPATPPALAPRPTVH